LFMMTGGKVLRRPREAIRSKTRSKMRLYGRPDHSRGSLEARDTGLGVGIPCYQGNLQGIPRKLARSADLARRTGHNINSLRNNSLRIRTGNLIVWAGNLFFQAAGIREPCGPSALLL